MAIQKNTIVKVIGGLYDGRVGKVVNTYPEIDFAVVSFEDNGDVGKVSLSSIVEVQPQADRIVDVKIEIPEGAKKISRADFEAELKRVTSPTHGLNDNSRDAMSNFLRSITTMLIGKKVTEKIFEDQDVIVVTEDGLISAIWSVCDPVSVCEMVDGKMSPRKCITVAMTAMIGFEEIVGILFGAENG